MHYQVSRILESRHTKMANKAIPQVDFDKSVQRVISLGLNRVAAENIVITLWNISVNKNLDFKVLMNNATYNGKLDVDQSILDDINKTLPDTVKYYKANPRLISPVAAREL